MSSNSITRQPYPPNVSDEEWAFVAPYLTSLPEDVSQRKHPLRKVFNALRYLVKTGVQWRMLPHDLRFAPWPVVYQQMLRWLAAQTDSSHRDARHEPVREPERCGAR